MLTRDGSAEPISRNQTLRHVRGEGNIHFPCLADHEQECQIYSVDPYSAGCDDHTYIHTLSGFRRRTNSHFNFIFVSSVSLPGDDVLYWLLSCSFILSAFPAFFLRNYSRLDLVWFRLSCDHGWIRSGSVNVR